ncbi:MAG: EndoU domain-containing protein, partial [Candidatus Dependentiae bacterium]|nr:EndoU domain-containing protein [Candidatus Dependentiae bacterium]
PENTIERAHLKRHIQDGYRLHGEDIKLYKTEYEKAESLLFPTEHKIRSSGSAAAERADTLTLKPKQQKKHAHNKGKAAQQSDAQDAQLRAEKDTKLKQLALEQRHGVQPTRRGELPPSASEPYRPFSAYMGDRPSECGSDLSIEESNSFASAEHAVKMMPSSACAASESKDLTDNPYIVIPYGNGVLRLNRAHLFDGEAGNKGLHHDYERQLEKSNAFAYTHPKTNRFESENNGCYILDITKDGRTEIKSFFPAQWSAELLTARLINALQNNIQYLNGQEILGVITAYNPGEQVFNPIYFKAIVDRGVITTIFPVTHQRYLEIIEKQTKPKQEDQKEPFDSSDEQLAQQATEADMLARAIALSLADHNQEETKNEKKSPQLNRPEKKQQKKRKK